jgi:hypothetical protein
MEYFDANAVVDFGLALARLAGETVDETDFRKWVEGVIGILEQKNSQFPKDTSKRGCKVTISTSFRPGGVNDLGENIVLLRGVTSNQESTPESSNPEFSWAFLSSPCPKEGEKIPDWGRCCYNIGATRICFTWACSIFAYDAYPLI